MTTANRIPILSPICVIILVTTAIFSQTARKIAAIETEGLQALTTETVIATSGLKIGDTFSVEATDAAAQRLVDSGLFKRVAYRTRIAGANVTITFQVEEVKGQFHQSSSIISLVFRRRVVRRDQTRSSRLQRFCA